MSKESRILIFGGSGFIGLALVDELLKQGYNNIRIADINTPLFCSDERASFTLCDITNERNIVKTFEDFKPQIVVNLAGLANLEKAIESPKRTIELNVIGNLSLIEASVQYAAELFVYASSAYAMNDRGSFYGISKLTSEKIIEEFGKKYNMNFSILRYGSIYAASDFDNNYLFQLVREAVINNKIIHAGDGGEVREYIHVRDVSELTVKVLEDRRLWNSAWMLTGNERMKRSELFEMIREIIGNEGLEIEYSNEGYNNHYRFTPYSFQGTSAKKLIANPHYDMGQGILECVQKVRYEQEIKRLNE